MGLAINQAVHSTNCDSKNWDGNHGLVRSLCTVDIGGAIAYFSQAITFIQLAILNCRDYLDVAALCGCDVLAVFFCVVSGPERFETEFVWAGKGYPLSVNI